MTKDQIIEWIYKNPNIKKYCISICPNDWKDLRSELVIQIYKMNYEKLLLASQGNFLEYTCFTICKRILYGNISGSGIFYKKKNSIEYTGDVLTELEPNVDSDRIEAIYEIVEGSHWYSKTLFKEYYQNGMKLREISDKYGINAKSIHYTIKKLREEISKKLDQEGKKYI